MTSTARRVKGLGYLGLLLALFAGIPSVLYLFQGNPFAPLTELTTAGGIHDLLFTQDDGTLFLSALTLVGWAAWATFAYSIAVEVVAAARGARPRAIKGLGLQQRSAAALVGGALMILTAGTATAQPIADLNNTSHPIPAHTAPVSPTAPAKTVAPSWTQIPAQTPAGTTITTHHGDTLWSLAEHHLGDGTRYPEIRNLNQDKIGDDNWLRPGWTLTLPAAAPSLVDGAYTVQPGDTLWDLAEQHLGDGTRWREIHGAAGPIAGDLITVGQQLYLQSTVAHEEPAPAAPPEPQPPQAPAPDVVTESPLPENAPDPSATVPVPAPEMQEPSSEAEVAPAPVPEEVEPSVGVEEPAPVPEEVEPSVGAEEPAPNPDESAPRPDQSVTPPPLAAQNVPEQPEMVPGGDAMSQAEAAAAAEAAARVFGMVADANGNFVPADQIPTQSAPTPAPQSSPAPAPQPAPTPAPQSDSESAQTPDSAHPDTGVETHNEQYNAPENAPEPMPDRTTESAPESAAPAPSTPEPETVPAPNQEAAQAQAQAQAPAPAPAPELPPVQIPLDTTPVPAPENTAQTTELASEDEGIQSSTILGVSGLAAVALLAALGFSRRRQQHRRQRGERIPLPTGPAAEAEEAVRASADPTILNTLDVALRHIASHCRTTGQPLPALLGVFLHDESIELALLDEIDLPAPWTRSGDTDAWSIPLSTKIDAPTTAISPYPALVELGDLPDNSRILLNLEELGHLGVAATPETARDINRALAVFLAFSPLADNLNVTLVGFGEDLPSLVDTGHLTYADDADRVLERLARSTATDANTLDAAGIESIAVARTAYQDSEMTTPEIVLLAEPLTEHQKQVFTEILANAPRIAVAAVTATGDTTADWTLTARGTTAELARGSGTVFDLTPTKLTESDYTALIELLDTAHTDPQPTMSSLNDMWTAEMLDLHVDEAADIDDILTTPTPTLSTTTETTATPQEQSHPDHQDEPALTAVPTTPAPTIDTGHIWIHLLGTPTVTPLDGTEAPAGRGPSLTELAALLTTHPGIVNHDLDAKIWPHDPLDKAPATEQAKKKAVRRQNNLSRLRSWLGETESGELAFPKSGDRTGRSGYQLHPDVRTDWDIWNDLVNDHPATANDDQLTTATALVTGQPFTNPDPTKYVWAEHLQQEMIAATTDAIEELASRHLQNTGNARTAYELATRGLAIDTAHEGLWRIAIIASHACSDIDTTQQLIDDLLTELSALEVEPEDETATLLRLLADFHTTTGDTPYSISSKAS